MNKNAVTEKKEWKNPSNKTIWKFNFFFFLNITKWDPEVRYQEYYKQNCIDFIIKFLCCLKYTNPFSSNDEHNSCHYSVKKNCICSCQWFPAECYFSYNNFKFNSQYLSKEMIVLTWWRTRNWHHSQCTK